MEAAIGPLKKTLSRGWIFHTSEQVSLRQGNELREGYFDMQISADTSNKRCHRFSPKLIRSTPANKSQPFDPSPPDLPLSSEADQLSKAEGL